MKLSQVQVNDRVILPPFAYTRGFDQTRYERYEHRTNQRSTSRRVLEISKEGDTVTIVLDGHEPRTLPADLDVIAFR